MIKKLSKMSFIFYQKNYHKAYNHWLLGRKTLSELCVHLDVSYLKLITEFDKSDYHEGL